MKQKKSYKNVKPDAIVREYRTSITLLWILHALTIPAAGYFIVKGFCPELPTIQEKGWKNPSYTLNIARSRYYQGDWQGAAAELQKMPMPKEKSVTILQYYNLQACCMELEGDFARIPEIREKVKKILSTVKEKSNIAANGRQLLTIIDGTTRMPLPSGKAPAVSSSVPSPVRIFPPFTP